MNFPGGFTFLQPWFLLGLALVPALAWWLGRRGPIPTLRVPTLQGLDGLPPAPKRQRGAARWAWGLLALTLGILALARPRIPRGETPDPSRGIDIMLTLDFSRSMAEEDFRLDRKRVSRR